MPKPFGFDEYNAHLLGLVLVERSASQCGVALRFLYAQVLELWVLIFLLVGQASHCKKGQQAGATCECINGQQHTPQLVQDINLIDQTFILQ